MQNRTEEVFELGRVELALGFKNKALDIVIMRMVMTMIAAVRAVHMPRRAMGRVVLLGVAMSAVRMVVATMLVVYMIVCAMAVGVAAVLVRETRVNPDSICLWKMIC